MVACFVVPSEAKKVVSYGTSKGAARRDGMAATDCNPMAGDHVTDAERSDASGDASFKLKGFVHEAIAATRKVAPTRDTIGLPVPRWRSGRKVGQAILLIATGICRPMIFAAHVPCSGLPPRHRKDVWPVQGGASSGPHVAVLSASGRRNRSCDNFTWAGRRTRTAVLGRVHLFVSP